jgi:hypothetical protein
MCNACYGEPKIWDFTPASPFAPEWPETSRRLADRARRIPRVSPKVIFWALMSHDSADQAGSEAAKNSVSGKWHTTVFPKLDMVLVASTGLRAGGLSIFQR